MDKDVLLVIVGGLIGLISSLLTIIAQRKLDEKGELNIFYRFYNEKSSGASWRFERGVNEIIFRIPIVFEFQNTTNVTRVLRDVSLFLYNGDECLCKMDQVHQLTVTNLRNQMGKNNDFYFGTEKGSYSFVIDPRSISRVECEYIYKTSFNEIQNSHFDTIKLGYFDERNNPHLFTLRKVNDCWEVKTYQADKDWILAK